jgi:hypothetical protein
MWTNSANHAWTSFSRGDGTTTFRVPDFRGEFMRFFDDARGVDQSRVLGTQQNDIVGTLAMSGVVDLINPKLSFGPMDMANQIPGGGGAPPVLPPNYRNAYMQNGELTFTSPRSEVYNITGGGWPDTTPDHLGVRDVGYNQWPAITGALGPSYGYVEVGWVIPYQDLKPPVSIYPSAWPPNWIHRENRITSAMNLSGSGGGTETRPRNCAVMPCIVDG